VEKARKKFYNAFGRFSIALPISFFLSGVATGYENAAVWGGEAEKEDAAETSRKIANVAVAVTVGFFLVPPSGSWAISAPPINVRPRWPSRCRSVTKQTKKREGDLWQGRDSPNGSRPCWLESGR
jgi:hypothetical protein